MIDRELLRRAPRAKRKLDRAALRNHEACSGQVPALQVEGGKDMPGPDGLLL